MLLQWMSMNQCLSEIVRTGTFVLLPYFLIASTDEAFAAKHMPDLGHDVKEFRVFSWKLTGWKKLEKKLTSPEFDSGGHRW